MPISERGPVMERILRRTLHAVLMLPLLALAPACMVTVGESSVENELTRLDAIRGIGLVSATPLEAVIAARGAKVVVRPAPGSCIARDSIETSELSAFLLLTDCALERLSHGESDAATSEDGERLIVAPGFPGLVTISVAGEPRAPLPRLKSFLESPEGQAELGRGVIGEEVEIENLRIVEDVLFVLAKDRDPEAVPLLSRTFWRAFTEVSDRLVLVTVSGFRAHELGEEAMLEQLVDQVLALRIANGGPGIGAGPTVSKAMAAEIVAEADSR